MNLTMLLTIALVIVIILLILLFSKHNKLRNDFKNYNPNPVYGPGRYNYGRDNPYRILKDIRKEERLEVIRNFLTFKWFWYWTTKDYRNRKKIKKDLNKNLKESVEKRHTERRRRSRILDDISNLASHPKIK